MSPLSSRRAGRVQGPFFSGADDGWWRWTGARRRAACRARGGADDRRRQALGSGRGPLGPAQADLFFLDRRPAGWSHRWRGHGCQPLRFMRPTTAGGRGGRSRPPRSAMDRRHCQWHRAGCDKNGSASPVHRGFAALVCNGVERARTQPGRRPHLGSQWVSAPGWPGGAWAWPPVFSDAKTVPPLYGTVRAICRRHL